MANRSLDALRTLCIKHNWFNGGTNSQYVKLFDRAHEGASLEELAIIIWVCTADEVEQSEIVEELKAIWCE